MGSLNERNPSLWVETSPETRYRALSGKPSFDAIVIGGGIAGLPIDPSRVGRRPPMADPRR